MKRTVRSTVGEVTIRETGLVYARAFPNVEIGLEEAMEHYSMVEYLTHGEPHCTIIDITGIASVSAKARAFLQEQSSKWGKTLGVALVTNSFAARVVGNFFLTVNKPDYPVKIFTDSLEAHQWARNEYQRSTRRVAS